MISYYLAIDIGASNGRHVLGYYEEEQLHLEEVYRFENGMETVSDGKRLTKNKDAACLCWNTDRLFEEILNGMRKCYELGKIPKSVSIDTWGVDYVLLDEEGNPVGKAFGYRDTRTEGMIEKVWELVPEETLYDRTGIAAYSYNTIYQLMAVREQRPAYFKKAKTMLMTPDYYAYLLTGVQKQEYTIATTSGLLDIRTNDWDEETIAACGYPRELFLPVNMPGTVVGRMKNEIVDRVGFQCEVVTCASHDTASAVTALPAEAEGQIFISSGTWSLLGTETKTPYCDENSRLAGFTNEGGYEYRYRYLRNIMGLWMLQSVKKETGTTLSYAEIGELAKQSEITSMVDCNDARFLAPQSMTEAIQEYLRETNQTLPSNIGEYAKVIYQSLAKCYAEAVEELEKITQKSYDTICILGGGSNADYLNRLTAEYTKKKVIKGPAEATATGNLLVQMMRDDVFLSLQAARECVSKSLL